MYATRKRGGVWVVQERERERKRDQDLASAGSLRK